VDGRPLDPKLLGHLEGLANRGYTDGFFRRHAPAEYQNYLRGHSESGRSLYVGDIVAFDPLRGLVEFEAKNKLTAGDRIELVQPGGLREFVVDDIRSQAGEPLRVVPGNGHKAWLRLPPDSVGAFVARFLV
jgi:putative protease